MEIERPLQTEYPTLKYCNNCFQRTQCHQNHCRNHCDGGSQKYGSAQNRNQRKRSKQMLKQMSSKHVTVKSCSEANCAKSVTNRFLQNKKRCHRPRRSTRQKQTYKFISLTFYPNESNGTLQSNTHSESKSCLSCDCRAEGYLPEGVTSLNNKEKNGEPSNCNFALVFRKNPPSRGQTVSLTVIYRTGTQLAPFLMYTFQSLSVPKTTNRFAKTRKSTISSLCSRMVIRMIPNQYLQYNSTTNSPNIDAKHRSHKRLMQRHQWNTSPSLSSRCKKDKKIDIHNYIFLINV